MLELVVLIIDHSARLADELLCLSKWANPQFLLCPSGKNKETQLAVWEAIICVLLRMQASATPGSSFGVTLCKIHQRTATHEAHSGSHTCVPIQVHVQRTLKGERRPTLTKSSILTTTRPPFQLPMTVINHKRPYDNSAPCHPVNEVQPTYETCQVALSFKSQNNVRVPSNQISLPTYHA